MAATKLVKHAPGAPGLRLLGLGPGFRPSKGLKQLKILFNNHAFWAKDRNEKNIKKLLAESTVVISVWEDSRIIGFGRATSDSIYRAVLWDVIVPKDLQGQGLGKKIVEALLNSRKIKKAERVYLMTSNSAKFYNQFGFKSVTHQSLLLKESSNQCSGDLRKKN